MSNHDQTMLPAATTKFDSPFDAFAARARLTIVRYALTFAFPRTRHLTSTGLRSVT
ncbi:hypothetical protein L13192_05020 [Pyrenophora tritici-repentis]|nr:hypothetical protein L13192_05020 [Pyrenophora tritici-repentis]